MDEAVAVAVAPDAFVEIRKMRGSKVELARKRAELHAELAEELGRLRGLGEAGRLGEASPGPVEHQPRPPATQAPAAAL